jgi:hypothetical protein
MDWVSWVRKDWPLTTCFGCGRGPEGAAGYFPAGFSASMRTCA